ncbi:NADH-quinone oxidoreductase subunit L [Geothermobacter hydrogeniphilus]|uniref:NADH-quinone oxidoreductase subunit L n=1 Tax=Geothermobacter hydrogeniphilus TaxID=1969733 RepID=A0A2K2HEQ4_9BACT|nr:NADH-quinone oxidoreductase subunit L [Geothermobacter hydrogeniphilus]PNU21733.1 NADH-quinone oxidoreductase subunit L [Geothermobacter hydrogeniphilus]
MNAKLLFLIPLLPLIGAGINILFGMRFPRAARGWIAVAAVSASFVASCLLWPLSSGEGTRTVLATWLASGNLRADFGILFDPLAASMTLMVTGVSTLIHLYAVGYMEKEQDTARFFALLNLFVFAMLTIVLADNLLLLFLGWEGVGFCSYGLIGFWYRELKNARAGQKAFLVTRVGDVFFAIALLWLFSASGQLGIPEINAFAGQLPAAAITAIVLLLLAGASGKSAQLPLMTWLPDAMAGPTPVSALIHAATMVTAGVYLLCRLFPLVSLSATGMTAIALVGGLTAFYAATCALAQREIKRVLAYSTMSQIGYMFIAVGAGSVSGAMFHLYTHAFFKALLFMGAGCVIHLCHEENDIYKMGGVAKKSPLVTILFLAGLLCLAGAPLTGGFFSKDGILVAAYAAGGNGLRLAWALGTLSALLTSFYSFRLFFLVFTGPPRSPGKPHPLPTLMRWTLPPLALLGLFGGLFNLPSVWGGHELLHRLLTGSEAKPLVDHATELALTVTAVCLFALGLFAAVGLYRSFPGERPAWYKHFLLHGWQADRLVEWSLLKPFRAIARFCGLGLDQTVIEGTLHGLAGVTQKQGDRTRQLATGRISTYLHGFAWGLVLMLGWFLLEMVKG